MSSTEAFNDYAPTPYRDGEKRDVLGFVNSLSPTLGGRIDDVFVPVVPPAVPAPVPRPAPVG